MLRLPHEVAPLFREWLGVHFPDRADKVMAIVRSVRGGRDNDSAFGARMRGQGELATLLRRRFEIACKRHGLHIGERGAALDHSLFKAPRSDGQLGLF